MIKSTTHNHCDFCDGQNNLDEMIQGAIKVGFTDFGISCHGRCDFDSYYGVKDELEYIRAVNTAKEQYKDKINIAIGTEQDVFAPIAYRDSYDYIIGSIHYLQRITGEYVAIDATTDKSEDVLKSTFGGDGMAMVREFYRVTLEQVQQYKPDIIGHFDIITKTNRIGNYFDENSTEYKNLALDTAEKCLKHTKIFEVNTGAMAKGSMIRPYPDRFILEGILEMGGKVTINADCHKVEWINFGFEKAEKLLKDIGFKETYQYINGEFTPIKL